ncbi:MAG: DUF4491 family protein [Proteobacteria bacterium]|nr:DUF4491 family protein [Pseudomonadota bacterium]
MSFSFTGLILAGVTVGTIAIGHELVRKLNYHFGTRPAAPLFLLGAAVLGASLWCASNTLSAALGIVGLTTIVDGYEILRQEKRIQKGHAPENPKRPVRRP